MIVVSDLEVRRIAQARLDHLNRLSSVHLIGADVPLTPATPLAALLAPTFDTYVPYPLAGIWRPIIKATDGEWLIQAGPFSWNPPFLATGTIYGFYITDGVSWVFGELLPDPVFMGPTSLPFDLAVEYQLIAGAVFPGVAG